MEIRIGAKIKSLRLSQSMTQEQLAQKLRVSAQTVSKWESETNMPDIHILPEISVIFGISIDELFSMTDDYRMNRIERQIENTEFLSWDGFRQDEEFLLECMHKEPTKARAILVLARLYNKRAEEYHARAKPLARSALLLNPGEKSAHNAIFKAEGGPCSDWNVVNHWELISFYKQIVEENPRNIPNYYWLLDLLIMDHRLEEAREYAQRMKQQKHTYHYEMYMGYICKEDCDLEGARSWWKKMEDRYPDDWIVLATLGDISAKLCNYEDAVRYYQAAMPLRIRPRYIDCEEAIAQICMIRGDLEGALQMQKKMLRITMEDWSTEGKMVEEIQKNINALEKQIKGEREE